MNNRLFILWFAGRGYILAAMLGILVRMRMHDASPLRWEFLPLIAIAIILRVWAGAHLGPHGNAMQAQSPLLCTSGPYRFSRNPLYIANILTGAGLILFANCLAIWMDILILILLFAHHALLIHWEEQKLIARWGSQYEIYLRATPRWLGKNHVSTFGDENKSAQWSKVWIWQGRNLAYTVLSIVLLWSASKWR